MKKERWERIQTKGANWLIHFPVDAPEDIKTVAGLLVGAIVPISPFGRGPSRVAKLSQRAFARRRLRRIIEDKLPKVRG